MIRSYCFDTDKDWDDGIHKLFKSLLGSVYLNLYLDILLKLIKLMKEKFLSNNDRPLNLLQY